MYEVSAKVIGVLTLMLKCAMDWWHALFYSHVICTYMTMAEFFMIRPHGPNCWMGEGAFNERVRL